MQRIITKREKIILYITIGVIVFSIGFNFLFMPLLTKNDNLNKEINISRVKLTKYLRLLSQKDSLQTKYSKLAQDFKVSSRQEGALVTTLAELENMAKNSNIRIVDIRPQAPKSADLYKEVIIELRTEGTMESYLGFIYTLENSLLLLRIKKIQLNAKPNTPHLEGIFSISQVSLLE